MSYGITGITNLPGTEIVTVNKYQSARAADAALRVSTGTRLINASVDPSSLAIAAKLQSDIRVNTQACSNAAQGAAVIQVAAGGVQNILDLLTGLNALATKANNQANDAGSFAAIDAEYQKLVGQINDIATRTRWGDVTLLSGSLGTANLVGAVAANAVAGLAAIPATTFDAAPINVANSRGFISGMFTDATVVDYGAQYKVTLTMKHSTAQGTTVTQTFAGVVEDPVAGESFVLSSTTDDRNVLFLDYDAADVSGLGTAATFQTALRTALNIGNGLTGATVASSSTALNGGVTAITASSATPAGEYQLEYFPGPNIMKVTNGALKYEKVMTAAGAQTVTFGNGVSVTTDGTFALATPVTQVGFSVATGNQVSMTIQVGNLSTDTLTVDIGGATVSALGLTGTNVGDATSAATASTLIKSAIDQINRTISQLGAQQKQLDSVQKNLETTIQNNKAARTVYSDSNVADDMIELTSASVFTQLSNAMISQTRQLQEGLVRLVAS